MGRMKSVLAKQEAERRYPHHVDVPVPPDGLGRDLDAMINWIGATLREPLWDMHGHLKPGREGEVSRHVARFYFYDVRRAEEFARQFGDLGAETSD